MLKSFRRLFSHVVASFIFNKRVAKKVKADIKYGLFRKIRESRDLRAREIQKKEYENDLAIVAIMKNEGSYLQEWIEYHKLVGVSKFYLYDNESSDDTKKILAPYIKSGLVEYVYFPGQKRQLPAYEDCIKKHKNDAKWLAVIDLDEYIVPVKYDSVVDFLNGQKSNVAQIIIPWVIFGSNGHKEKPKGGVLENYTMRARKNWLYKAIINPRLVFNMGCHEHNVAGRTISVPMSIMRVHHYHCKSWQEYKLKALRGDAWDGADAGVKKYQMDCFKKHDLNEVKDETVLRFLSEMHRKIHK